MNDIEGIRLLRNIRRIANKPPTNNMIFGEIVSVDPLKIDIGNNIVLTKKFLYLGQMCRPHTVTIPHTHKYNGETEKATATAGGVITTPPPPDVPSDSEVGSSNGGDLSFVFAGQGTLTVTEMTGHSHEIKDQETDDVHEIHEEGHKTDYEDCVILEIYPKLAVGDKVLMFAMNNNQMYYVAERIEA